MVEFQFDMIMGSIWVVAAGFYHDTIPKIYILFMGVGIMWLIMGCISKIMTHLF